MTPKELYLMNPEKVTNEVEHLAGFSYNHVTEIGEEFNIKKYSINTERVEIRFIKDWHYDYRRVWQLATVWFDGIPVMVIQNAGREGDDYAKRFITNKKQFEAMCAHIKQLISIEDCCDEAYDDEASIEGLTEFYNQRLDGYFEKY